MSGHAHMVGITMCILYICECKLYAIVHIHVSGNALVLKIIIYYFHVDHGVCGWRQK